MSTDMHVLPANIAKRVRVTKTGCWEFLGATNSKGYGTAAHQGRVRLTHRIAYELAHGNIPAGLVVDHLCHNKRCCNPAHLEAITVTENNRRAWRDGLQTVSPLAKRNAAKTHCPAGHEYTGDNLRVTARGYRVCRACHRARAAKRRRSA